jgi:hypothetical protein
MNNNFTTTCIESARTALALNEAPFSTMLYLSHWNATIGYHQMISQEELAGLGSLSSRLTSTVNIGRFRQPTLKAILDSRSTMSLFIRQCVPVKYLHLQWQRPLYCSRKPRSNLQVPIQIQPSLMATASDTTHRGLLTRQEYPLAASKNHRCRPPQGSVPHPA